MCLSPFFLVFQHAHNDVETEVLPDIRQTQQSRQSAGGSSTRRQCPAAAAAASRRRVGSGSSATAVDSKAVAVALVGSRREWARSYVYFYVYIFFSNSFLVVFCLNCIIMTLYFDWFVLPSCCEANRARGIASRVNPIALLP